MGINLNSSNIRAQNQEIDGIKFPSKLEAGVYLYLKKLEKYGAIKVLQRQPKVVLSAAEIVFKPDFKIFDPKLGGDCFVEAKGVETDSYLIKLKLYKTYGKLPLMIFKGTMDNPKLVEIINPRGVDNGI